MNNFMHDASMIGAGITLASGLMLWIGEHANAIGAITTILMLLLTAIFHVLNFKVNKKRLDLEERRAKRDGF
jgi:hypothetical protein